MTTDAQKHFLGFQISSTGQNLSLSISETIRGDTQTQVDTLKKVFNDLSDVMSSDSMLRPVVLPINLILESFFYSRIHLEL
jgi:hypothetical protein